MLRYLAFAVLLSICAALAPPQALAQTFPSQRVTVIIPFPPGGPTDLIPRLMAPGLEELWGQSIVLDYHPGAAGSIGAAHMGRANPDGHTLLFTGEGTVATVLFVREATFNLARDSKPLTSVTSTPYLIVAPPQVPVKSLKEFIAYAKGRAAQMNWATIENSNYHLDQTEFFQKAGLGNMVSVPYPGAAAATTAVLRNDVQIYFGAAFGLASYIADGKLTPLAVTSAERYSRMPNVPTVRESGFDYVRGFGFGYFAPAGISDALATRIARDIVAVAKRPEVSGKLTSMGFDVVTSEPNQYKAQVEAMYNKYVEIANRLSIKPQ